MSKVTKETIARLDAFIEQQNKEFSEKHYFPVTYLCPLDKHQKTVSVHAKTSEETISIFKQWLDEWVIKESEKRRLEKIQKEKDEIAHQLQENIIKQAEEEFALTATHCNGCKYFDESNWDFEDDENANKCRGCTFGEYNNDGSYNRHYHCINFFDWEDEGVSYMRPDDCPTRMRK